MSRSTKFKQFIFHDYRFDSQTGILELEYSLDNEIIFIEELVFPPAELQANIDQELLERALFNLFLAAGISYWKTYCPKEIIISDAAPNGRLVLQSNQAQFWNIIYTKGLGEFYYKNQIDFCGLVHFPFSSDSTDNFRLQRKNKTKKRVLIPFGGGKDSAVVAKLIKQSAKEFSLFTLRDFPVVNEFAKHIGGEHIVVYRKLAGELLRLQRNDDCYTGHVPITAIISFLAVVICILYGYDDIVYSNEYTASMGNLKYLGIDINHQWSKSFEAEQLIADYIKKNISSHIRYFSLLRPFTELKIAEVFSQCKKYFSYFSSCNSNFFFGQETSEINWCCNCSKCLFVFIMLAPWLCEKELIGIFGKNLFEDETQVEKLKNLLGIGNGKPFECVGTPKEVQAAMILSLQKEEFFHTPLVEYFVNHVLVNIKDPHMLISEALQFHNTHHIPEDYLRILPTS